MVKKKLHIISIREEDNQDPDTASTSRRPYVRPRARKRFRGPTKMKEIYDLEIHERILVTFDVTWQPIGDGGNALANFIGTLVRNPLLIGIQYPDWRKVPKDIIQNLMSMVEAKFEFSSVDSDGSKEKIKKWIKTDMSYKWRSWKYELKRRSYNPSLTVEDIVNAQTDDRVEEDQFRSLVAQWFTVEKQVQTEENKKTRLKSKEPHVTGSKSFARIIEEETQKNGIRPSRGGVYRISRTCKDGHIVNDKAFAVVKKLKKLVGETSTIDPFDWTNDDLSIVKGPESGGRVRCAGRISIPKERKKSYKALEKELNQVKDKLSEVIAFITRVGLTGFPNHENSDDDDEEEEEEEDGDEDVRRRQRRDVIRLQLRDFATQALSRQNRILDWAEILMGLEDHSIEFRFQVPGSNDGYIGNPGDYVDAAGYEALLQTLAESDSGKRGSPPAAKSVVEALPTVEVIAEVVKLNESEVCAICKDKVFNNENEIVKKLPCGHMYHEDCIVPWLGSRNTCPICRYELPTDDPEYEEDRKKRMSAMDTSTATSSGGAV